MLASLAAAADLAALWAAFVVRSSSVCTLAGPPFHQTCRPVPLINAFGSPLAIGAVVVLVAIGLLPLVGAILGRRWPAWFSLVSQSIVQLLSLGTLWYWLPAWLCTLGVVLLPFRCVQSGEGAPCRGGVHPANSGGGAGRSS